MRCPYEKYGWTDGSYTTLKFVCGGEDKKDELFYFSIYHRQCLLLLGNHMYAYGEILKPGRIIL